MSSVPDRADIDSQYKWDLSSIFSSDEEWEETAEQVRETLSALREFEGRVTEGPETLRSVLELREEIMRDVHQLSAYARMRRDEDTRVQYYQALTTRAQSLAADARSAASFIGPEIQELDRDEVRRFQEAESALAEYDHYFDEVLRMKPHTRSTEVEALLADLSDVTGSPGEIYTLLTNADMTFPTVEDSDGEPVEITLANFTKLQKRPDRQVRRDVYEAFYDEWEAIRNAVGTAYQKSATTDEKLASARNHDSARAAALYGPNIPESLYDTLIETVEANLEPLHTHTALKRQALGVDELRMWDLYMPVATTETPTIEYSEAATYIVEAVRPLGDEYRDRLAAGLESRWVDVYNNEGKQSGAYSGGTYDTQPFILMNYQDDISSMYTLAHELGHSLHSEYTSEQQPWIYSDYDIFVAEVASTVNETLLTHHLMEVIDDPDLRLHILNEYLERIRSTLYRQTMFATFEHDAHRRVDAGEALTPTWLDDHYRSLKATYYEPAVVDDRIAREWMRIPHFYRAYYVFQYATGIAAAAAIVDHILEVGAPAAERYREFLGAGSSDYPLELLGIAGVDMDTSAPIEAAIDTYRSHLETAGSLLE